MLKYLENFLIKSHFFGLETSFNSYSIINNPKAQSKIEETRRGGSVAKDEIKMIQTYDNDSIQIKTKSADHKIIF